MIGRGGLVIAMAAAFLLGLSVGLATGVIVMRFGTHGMPFAMGHAGPWAMGPGFEGSMGPMGGGPGQMMLLHHLDRELGLTPEQHERVVQVLERARGSREATRDSVRAGIERILDDHQRARWHALERRFEGTRHGRFGGPRPEELRP